MTAAEPPSPTPQTPTPQTIGPPAAAPQFEDIAAAAERMSGHAVRTPLLESPLLNRAVGRRILLKAECLQRTGSFKFRGAWSHLTARLDAAKAQGVLAYSSGNHAQGVAAAAAALGCAATIVMPEDAPDAKRSATLALGATIIPYDRAGGASRELIGRDLIERDGLHVVRPYDDFHVIAGQGVVGLELAEQARDAGVTEADVLVCSGGGGLASGVALALAKTAPALRVRTVEPAGFDDWARSLSAGAPVENTQRAGSICDAILTPKPGALTWEIGRRHFGPGLAVSDRDARRAMALAARHLKLVLEPGGAVSLAAAAFAPEFDETPDRPLIAVASGGNVDLDAYADWIQFPSWSERGAPI